MSERAEKNADAVERGRAGGKKGGKARAKRLTAAERSETARRAARARWVDADSKPMMTWLVGAHSQENAITFMRDVRSRLTRRIQLTTDGHGMYLTAVRMAFKVGEVDYAMLVKQYGQAEAGVDASRRYSPPVCTGAEKVRQIGRPDMDLVSTSYVERSNLTLRMQSRRFTRLTNAFSKKAENHAHAVSLFFLYYNYCRPHQTLTKTANGTKITPAMAASLTDRVWTVKDIVALMDPAAARVE